MTYEDVGLDELFEPPSEPDGTKPKRERRERDPAKDLLRVCMNAESPAHAARPAPHPGPRCATCRRAQLRDAKKRRKERLVEELFGLTPEQYDRLYEAQGGRCYVCQRASGKSKRLAPDHDHVLAVKHGHDPKRGCIKCVRGLACGWCNFEVLGRLGDNPATYERIAEELRNPPARRLFGVRDE